MDHSGSAKYGPPDNFFSNHLQMVKTRKKWSPSSMESAVKAVLKSEMGYLKASKSFGVPLTNVKRFVARMRTNVSLERSVLITQCKYVLT